MSDHDAVTGSVSPNAAAFLAELGEPDEDPSKGSAELLAKSLAKESDRGCAILGAAILDDALERLLRTFFRSDETTVKHVINPLFEGYGPLSTFSGRIQLAFAMCLIPRGLKQLLDTLRRLRNDLAHQSGPLDFDDPRCRDRVNLLIGEAISPQHRDESELVNFGDHLISRRRLTTRLAFSFAVAGLCARIGFLEDVIRANKDIRTVVGQLEQRGL